MAFHGIPVPLDPLQEAMRWADDGAEGAIERCPSDVGNDFDIRISDYLGLSRITLSTAAIRSEFQIHGFMIYCITMYHDLSRFVHGANPVRGMQEEPDGMLLGGTMKA